MGRRGMPAPETTPTPPQNMATRVHFEIPTDDLERAKKFYAELFGWKIERYPGPMEYWMITTTNEKGEKAVDGGMMQRQNPQQPITNYIGIPSIDEYAVKVEKLGGKVVVPKMAVPGIGYFAVCLDTENNCWLCGKTTKTQNKKISGVRNSAVASQPCPSGHITADKRLRFTSPKLPSATSFIRRTLYAIGRLRRKI